MAIQAGKLAFAQPQSLLQVQRLQSAVHFLHLGRWQCMERMALLRKAIQRIQVAGPQQLRQLQ